MTLISISLVLFSALFLHPQQTQALLLDLPRQTSTADEALDPRGSSPRPTDQPFQDPSYIFKRQNFPTFPGDAGIAVVAPDSICGYISGLQGAPYSCSSKYTCLFFSASSDSYGPLACCTSGMSCKIRTACVARTDYYGPSSNSFCNAGCKLDLYTLKCTDANEPYCGRVLFTSPNIQDYWCVSNTASASPFHNATTTFPGQPRRLFTTISKTDLWPVLTSSSALSPSAPKSKTSEENSSPTSDESAKSSQEPAQSKPLGAIIGGVLGGVAVLALIGFGVFILYRRYREPTHEPLTSQYTAHEGYATGQPELGSRGEHNYMMTDSQRYTDQAQVHQHYDPPKPVISQPQELYAAPTSKRNNPVEISGQEIRK